MASSQKELEETLCGDLRFLDGGADYSKAFKSKSLGRVRKSSLDNMTDGLFRELDKINTPLTAKWRNAAIAISFASIVFNLALGVTNFVFSIVAWSPAAFGFGSEVLLDCLSSIVVLWRFLGSEGQTYSFEKERKACLGMAYCFMASAIVISGKAIYTIIIDEEPKRNEGLLVVSAASFVLLFIMAYIKYIVAFNTDSKSLKIDAFNTTAGGVMAFAMTLTTLLYEQSKGIWFLDATVALCIALCLFLYGVRTLMDVMTNKGTPVPSN